MKTYFTFLIVCLYSSVTAQTAIQKQDSILSNGIYRKYVLYVPAIYNSATAVPLIVDIHGYTGDGNQQMEFGDFRPIADTANFIVVHPTALGKTPSWAVGGTEADGEADRTFLFNLLDTLKSKYTINPNKVFSAGFSQGGLMGYNLACYENLHFAAIASVSGGMTTATYASCKPNRPMPILEIHGTTDPLAGYNGISTLIPSSPHGIPIDTVINYWVNYNRCSPVPTKTNLPNLNTTDSSSVEHYVYSGGSQGASVELFKVIGGGHSWPANVSTGGTISNANGNYMSIGNRNMDFNASKEIWRFFSKYSLITGTEQQPSITNNVVIYPNPSAGIFTLTMENFQNTTVKILNVFGTLILEEKITKSVTTINLNTISTGIYFYVVSKNNGAIAKGKVIVQ